MVTALLAAMSFSATANAYEAEVTGSFNITDIDIAGADDIEGYGLKGKIFLSDVMTGNGPLAEAAFLDRSTNIYLGYNRAEAGDIKSDSISGGVEYFSQSGLYVNANIGRTTLKVLDTDLDTTTYSAELGYIPVDGLLLAIGAVGANNDESDSIDPTLRVKYVAPIGSGDIGIEAFAGLGDIDTQSLAVDYYFDKSFSAGVDILNNNAVETKSYGFNAKKFFGEQFNLGARIGFGEISGIDTVTYGATAQYRW